MRKAVFITSLCLILIFPALLLNVSYAQGKLDLTLDNCVEMTLRNK